jgi:glutamate-1-semialdehyde aminotransferase
LTASGNDRVLAEAGAYTPSGVHTSIRIIERALCVRRADGTYIDDLDGARYIDDHAAFGPFVLEHCCPDIVERVVEGH